MARTMQCARSSTDIPSNLIELLLGPPNLDQPYRCSKKAWTKVKDLAEAFRRGESRLLSDTPLDGVNEHLWNKLLEMRPDAGRITADGPSASPVTRSIRIRNQPKLSYDTHTLYDRSIQKQAIEQKKADAQKQKPRRWRVRSNTPQLPAQKVKSKRWQPTARFQRAKTVGPSSASTSTWKPPTLVSMEPVERASSSNPTPVPIVIAPEAVFKKPNLPARPAAPDTTPILSVRAVAPPQPKPDPQIASPTIDNAATSSIGSPDGSVVLQKRRGRPPKNSSRFSVDEDEFSRAYSSIAPPSLLLSSHATTSGNQKRRGRPRKFVPEATYNSVLSIAQAATAQQQDDQPDVEILETPPQPRPTCSIIPPSTSTGRPIVVLSLPKPPSPLARRRSAHQSPNARAPPKSSNPTNPNQQPPAAVPKRTHLQSPLGSPAKQPRFNGSASSNHRFDGSGSSNHASSFDGSGPSGSHQQQYVRPITQTTNTVIAQNTPHIQNHVTGGMIFPTMNGNTVITTPGGPYIVSGNSIPAGMVPIPAEAAIAVPMASTPLPGQVIPVLPIVKNGTSQYVDISYFENKIAEMNRAITTMQTEIVELREQNRALAGAQAQDRREIEKLRDDLSGANNNVIHAAPSSSTNSRNRSRVTIKREPQE